MSKKAEKRRRMAAKPLPWPYKAQNARDCAAEEAAAAVRELSPLLGETRLDPTEIMRRIALIDRRLHNILRHLEGQGAKTEP